MSRHTFTRTTPARWQRPTHPRRDIDTYVIAFLAVAVIVLALIMFQPDEAPTPTDTGPTSNGYECTEAGEGICGTITGERTPEGIVILEDGDPIVFIEHQDIQ